MSISTDETAKRLEGCADYMLSTGREISATIIREGARCITKLQADRDATQRRTELQTADIVRLISALANERRTSATLEKEVACLRMRYRPTENLRKKADHRDCEAHDCNAHGKLQRIFAIAKSELL